MFRWFVFFFQILIFLYCSIYYFLILQNFNRVDLRYLRIASVIFFCACDVGTTIMGIGGENLGFAAHCGGAVNGLLIGLFIYKSESDFWRLRWSAFSFVCFLYLLLFWFRKKNKCSLFWCHVMVLYTIQRTCRYF